MIGSSLPGTGVVVGVGPTGDVEVSSDESVVAVGTPLADHLPEVTVDAGGAVQELAGGAGTAVVHRPAEPATDVEAEQSDLLVVDVEQDDEDAAELLRWLDDRRSELRDAADVGLAADGVLAAVGELLGVDAVELRSLDLVRRRWGTSAGPEDPPLADDRDAPGEWAAHVHLVVDLGVAPVVEPEVAERSALARPPRSVLGAAPAIGAMASFPLRHDGAHRGELVAWSTRPIGPRRARSRAAIDAVLRDLTARAVREPGGPAAPELVLEAIGHDLRSPLRAVANYAELLAVPGQPPDEDLLDFTVRMQSAARQANEQLDALVQFLDADGRTEPGRFDLGLVLDQIEASWGSSLSSVEIRARRPLGDLVARPELGLALSILVENSVTVAHGPGPVGVDVSVEPMAGGGRRIVLADGGPGRLRELTAFRWSDGSRSPSTVGPVLARRIVERDGGRLGVAVEDERTVWTIELPRRRGRVVGPAPTGVSPGSAGS